MWDVQETIKDVQVIIDELTAIRRGAAPCQELYQAIIKLIEAKHWLQELL